MPGWLQWQGEKVYVLWMFCHIFLTPTHDWIHDYIQDRTWDWTREWDSAFNLVVVWPNCRQVIISMLWMVRLADFASWAKPKKKTEIGDPEVAPKEIIPLSLSFPEFFCLPIWQPSESWQSNCRTYEGSQKYILCLAWPCYGLVQQ